MPASPANHGSGPAAVDDASDGSASDWRLDYEEDDNARRRKGWMSRLGRGLFGVLSGIKTWRRTPNKRYDYHVAPSDEFLHDSSPRSPFKVRETRLSTWTRRLRRAVMWSPLYVLTFFGLVHIVIVIATRRNPFWDTGPDRQQYLPGWGRPGAAGEGLAHYPTDATRDVIPRACHSHNDYWRHVPLFDALHWGCTSVEADVWLMDDSQNLYVGHDTGSLARNRTFRSLYVGPLVDLLDKMNPHTVFTNSTGNGVFDEDPSQTLVLLVDFKTDGYDLFPIVQQQLAPLRDRDHLSYWDGTQFISRAITVVGTGNTPFDLVVANKTYRDIFFDAPLDKLWEPPSQSDQETANAHDFSDPALGIDKRLPGQGSEGIGISTSPDDFNTSTSYYASVSLFKAAGLPLAGGLSQGQVDIVRGQIRGAKRRGLKARYWETPAWPTSLRNHIWQVLWEEGADIINADDLEAVANIDWTILTRHNWLDG